MLFGLFISIRSPFGVVIIDLCWSLDWAIEYFPPGPDGKTFSLETEEDDADVDIADVSDVSVAGGFFFVEKTNINSAESTTRADTAKIIFFLSIVGI